MPSTKKQINFLVNDNIIQQLKEIQEKNNFWNMSQVIRYCVAEIHRRNFPAYIQVQRDRHKNKKTPEEKAAEKVAVKKAMEQADIDEKNKRKTAICDLLGGQVVKNAAGHLVCEYTKHEEQYIGEVLIAKVECDLDFLNDETPVYQWRTALGLVGEEAKRYIEGGISSGKLSVKKINHE